MTDILFEAVEEVSGAQFAGVVGTDGVRIEMVTLEEELPVELEEVETEMIAMATAASQTANRLGSGLVQDITIESEDLVYYTSLVIPGYFAVLGVRSDGNIGRAKFALHRMVYRLKSEL